MTRKEFLTATAGAAALSVVPTSGVMSAACASSATGKPKRGVSLYVYSGLLYWQMELEDCFADMYDMGATGLEILANGHIKDYPNPTDEWVEWFKSMMTKYNIVPVEYGHWVDSRLHKGRELTSKESYDMLVKDIKLAHRLGFTVGRTKLGVIDKVADTPHKLEPVKNWKEFIEMALPVAEENNFKMCPEIHLPTLLKSKMIDEYVDFIEKTKTKWFGLNIDFGVFQNKPRPGQTTVGAGQLGPDGKMVFSRPEDIVPLLPYTYCCHAKFNDMSEDCQETTIPYAEVVDLMIKNKWDGYLLSEYEGANKSEPGYAAEQTRRQHVMLKRLLGE